MRFYVERNTDDFFNNRYCDDRYFGMFGHFTIVGQENNSELITINKKGMKLHSWIRRAASIRICSQKDQGESLWRMVEDLPDYGRLRRIGRIA